MGITPPPFDIMLILPSGKRLSCLKITGVMGSLFLSFFVLVMSKLFFPRMK